MKLYTIHDAKAEFYGQPFYARTNTEALRTFGQLVNDHQNGGLIAQSPADFTLFCIGEFDDLTGEVSSSGKQSLANGKDVQLQQ